MVLVYYRHVNQETVTSFVCMVSQCRISRVDIVEHHFGITVIKEKVKGLK